MIAQLAVAGIVLGHGLIHASYLAPRPRPTAGGPAWPFQLGSSRLLDALGVRASPGTLRLLGMALVAATVAGFGFGAIGALGVLPDWAWIAGTTVGGLASLALLVLFFHPWLGLGIAIDAILLWAVLGARWSPVSGG